MTQVQAIEIKNIPKMKNTLGGNKNSLDTEEKNTTESEDTATEGAKSDRETG